MLSNKKRAWIERNKGFILEMADLEDSGADVVSLFHGIIKQQGGVEMAKYALTDDGLNILKDRAFRKKLSPYQRDIYDQLVKKFKEDILDDPDKEAIKEYLREQQGCESPQERRSHVAG